TNPMNAIDPLGLCQNWAAYAQCLEDQQCEEIRDECEREANVMYQTCKDAADRVRDFCYAQCNRCSNSLARWACRRACDAVYAVDYAICRDAQGGYLLGCILAYDACAGGCWLGACGPLSP